MRTFNKIYSVSRPKVAVLLAANNGEKWIEDQIYSILNQRYVELTLWVSVDQHSDKTLDILNELISLDNRIKLLPIGLKFGSAAKNFFHLIDNVNFSDVDYVSFADQDDIWLDNKVAIAIKHLAQEGVDAYSSNVVAFWPGNGKYRVIDKSQEQRRLDFLFESAGPGCTFVFTKELAIDFQRFLKNSDLARNFVLHDWLLYAFARVKEYSWLIDSEPHMLYRQHEGNYVGANIGVRALMSRANRLIFKGGLSYTGMLLRILDGFPEAHFPKTLDRRSLLYFMTNANHIRRKPVERLYAFVVILLALAAPPRKVLYSKDKTGCL